MLKLGENQVPQRNWTLGIDHLIVSLGQLPSFSHSQCDAILRARHIEVTGAYNPDKSGFERDTVNVGLYWIVGWLLLVLTGLFFSWRRKDTNSSTAPRPLLIALVLIGLVALYAQLHAMAEYADTCQRLLR